MMPNVPDAQHDFSVPADDRILYAGQMERVKLRIDEADALLRRPKADERDLIYGAAQLRLAIEEIAFASLIGNRQAMEVAARSTRYKDWDAARKSLRSINPKYWPHAIRQVRKDHSTEWVDADGGLAEGEVSRVWGRLSALLHARNPWSEPFSLEDESAFLQSVVSRLRVLLGEHLVQLVGSRELLCCQVWASPVRVYAFGLVGDVDE